VKSGERLTGSQRKYLRGLAHSLDPVVHVGNAGLTEAVIAATTRALADHELVKVKIAADRDDRERMATEIEAACDADLAGMIGRIAILFRPKEDPEQREIVLPG
jgi:RNA-binding protein